MNPYRIEKLGGGHRLEGFDCGREELNLWLRKHGLQRGGPAGAAELWSRSRGCGAGLLQPGGGADGAGPGVRGTGGPSGACHAAAAAGRGPGISGESVGSPRCCAMRCLRTLRVAEIGGIRALVAYAGDERGCAFYRRFDFVASRVDPWLMVLRVGDVLGSAAR